MTCSLPRPEKTYYLSACSFFFVFYAHILFFFFFAFCLFNLTLSHEHFSCPSAIRLQYHFKCLGSASRRTPCSLSVEPGDWATEL